MKREKLIGINNFCCHSHSINKGKFVYSSRMYQNIAKSLNNDFLPAEQNDTKMYEKFL